MGEIQKWADSAMYTAEPIDTSAGPQVHLLWMTPDPLGAIAATCLMYEGKVIRDLGDITDVQRLHYLEEIQKTHLKAPFEFVQFHFLIEGVTRAFTHQMVRQRTAAFAQESLRFAVKDDFPVGLPPSLMGTTGAYAENIKQEIAEWDRLEKEHGPSYGDPLPEQEAAADAFKRERDSMPAAEKLRFVWDDAIKLLHKKYRKLIESGMPAEDARGLLPHNMLTRLHYTTNLRALLEHAGNRLCTQAQFEWRLVFSKIAGAIRDFGEEMQAAIDNELWPTNPQPQLADGFNAIADLLRPICYQTGRCEFNSSMDRACAIRERVNVRAQHGGVDSTQWHKPFIYNDFDSETGLQTVPTTSPGIAPAEWLLDPGAAR